MVVKLSSVSATCFEDFRNRKIDFQTFAHPLDTAVKNIPVCFQLEIVKLQESVDFKKNLQ